MLCPQTTNSAHSSPQSATRQPPARTFCSVCVLCDAFQCNASHSAPIVDSDRLMRKLMEEAINMLPAEEQTLETPTGETFTGLVVTKMCCAVSVIRSGECMEEALRTVWRDVKVGKLFIRTNHASHTPQVCSSPLFSCNPFLLTVLLLCSRCTSICRPTLRIGLSYFWNRCLLRVSLPLVLSASWCLRASHPAISSTSRCCQLLQQSPLFTKHIQRSSFSQVKSTKALMQTR